MTNLLTGTLNVQLLDSSGTNTLATLRQVLGSDFDATHTQRIPLSDSGVLSVPDTLGQPSGTAYVAAPGIYTLRLLTTPSDGGCTGTWQIWYPALSYVLLGTQA